MPNQAFLRRRGLRLAEVASYWVVKPNSHRWEAWLPCEGPQTPSFLSQPPWNLARARLAWRILAAQGVVLLDILLDQAAGSQISETNDVLLYLASSIFAALYLGQLPALFSCLCSLALVVLDQPRYPLTGPQHWWQHPLSFAFFSFTIWQISRLAERVRRESWKNRQRAQVLQLLSDFSQSCSEAHSAEQVRLLLEDALRAEPPSPFLEALQEELDHHAALTLERISRAEIEQKARVLEETQRLQSALIHSLSHDLQTPLASILGVFDALQSAEAPLTPQQGQKLVQLGHQQSERRLLLVRNLLQVGRLEGGVLTLQTQPISLEELVQAVLHRVPRSLSQRLLLSCSDPDPEVEGDATLLQQLVQNLLDNALKFSPPNSRVEIHLKREGQGIVLEVLDEGCGVALADREKIFEPFYRGCNRPHVPGSGLGLHLCKLLAELHKGTLSFEPRTEKGSCFRLQMPVRKQEGVPQSK